MLLCELLSISIDFALSWLVDFRGFILYRKFNVLSNLCVLNGLYVQDEAHQVTQSGFRLL